MSATPNNAAPGWGNAPSPSTAAQEARDADGHNALQGLLAFACIHQQAARRKRDTPGTSDSTPRFSREEELALDEILQLVAARAIAITGADGVAIALAKDRAIICRACAGSIAPDPGIKLDPDSGFSGACLRSGEIVRCDDSEKDPRVDPKACRTLGARSMIAVPLSAKKRVIGLLEAFSSEPYGFNDSDVRSLNLLGELILAAIRPEEEHHLAEMAREVLPDVVAAAKPESTEPAAISPLIPSVPVKSADTTLTAVVETQSAEAEPIALPAPAPKILVDEKFAPAARGASSRLATPESPALIGKTPTGEKGKAAASAVVPELKRAETKVAAVTPLAVDNDVASVIATKPVMAELVNARKAYPLEAPGEAPGQKPSLRSIVVTAAAIVFVIGMAAVLIWKYQHLGQAISANTQRSTQGTADDAHLHESAPGSTAPALKIGAIAQVTGIHHSSTADSSTLVVDLEDQVQYEEHSLDNPPRIYFDLHDTKLKATLANEAISIDDGFIKRVRVAQPAEGITRVVLETKNQPDMPSVSLENDPYRLTIQFHRTAAPVSQPHTPQPALPKPSPAISPSANKPRSSSAAPSGTGEFQIVLDAGHGGWDLGTVGKKGLLEKDLVFDIVQRLGKLLESRLGANVIYTREDDSYMALEKRAEIANLAHADLFLSVHANYSDLSTARGVETYFTRTYSSVKARTPDAASIQQVNWSGVVDIRAKVRGAKVFASDIQQALYGGLAARNPDIRNRGVKEAEYVVLTGTQMPAVLAEVSFVSSPADEDRLQSSEYRQLIAEALYKGVARYHEETQRTRIASLHKPKG